jgi:hypothetical protein
MGQYYLTVNLDKKQYLHPHKFGDGLKLREFGASGSGTMAGLAVLLSDGCGRGGGDLLVEPEEDTDQLIGSWAGDRIVVAGEYADEGRWGYNGSPDDSIILNLYGIAKAEFTDISQRVVALLAQDEYLRDDLGERGVWCTGCNVVREEFEPCSGCGRERTVEYEAALAKWQAEREARFEVERLAALAKVGAEG